MNNNRKEFIRQTAYNVLKKMEIKIFPFSIYDLISQFNEVKLFSFSKIALVISDLSNKKIPINDIPDLIGSDEAITYQKEDSNYITIYNDDFSQKTPQRIRFTLAHELGHMILGHFKNDKCYLGRNSISDDEHFEMEREADFFATELLAPKTIISPKWSVNDISLKFDISKTASSNIYDFIGRNPWIYKSTFFPSHTFCPNNFNICNVSPFLSVSTSHYYYCKKCSSIIKGNELVNNCVICGGSLIKKENIFRFRETRGREIMNYSGISVDMNGIADVCPRCGNENTQHYKYCEICGAMLINQCTGSINPYCNQKDLEDFEDLRFSCENGQHLSGQARYCPFCGSMSTFYVQQLLNDYTEEKSNIENNGPFQSFSTIGEAQ